MVTSVIKASLGVCSSSESLHVLFDSYLEESIKKGEKSHRAGNLGAIELSVLVESTPIPQQLEKFWNSSENKTLSLKLVRKVVSVQALPVKIILSGMVVNQEQVPAVLYSPASEPVAIPELMSWQEEADERIVPHAIWAVQQGCQRLVVVRNVTDSVVRLLYSTHCLQHNGLKELWIELHGNR